ncbi:MAG: hypothetical protein AB1424_10815 [Thermodesulfobacteriota bacterium]
MSVIDVCRIQEAQLASARDKLLHSVSSIIDNLMGISRNIMEISHNTQELSSANTEEEHSFLVEMERHLAEISSGLRQYGSASYDLALLMSSVAPAIGDMASCLRDIEAIEIAIERIALNACIKAAHLGEEGAALGVLAEGIQRLVGDTRQQTVTVSQKLESIISTAQELNVTDSSDKDESDMEVSLLINDTGAILQSLRALDIKAHSDLKQVQEKGSLLSDDLHRSCEGINVHERAAAAINRILADLNELSERFGSQALNGLERAGNLEVETLKNNYTMKAERLVHMSTAAPQPILKPKSILSQVQSKDVSVHESEKDKEDDLGDNVELF